MWANTFRTVLQFALLCAVTGFPWRGIRSGSEDPNDVFGVLGVPRTGTNWLSPYVSLFSSVIPSEETSGSAADGEPIDPNFGDYGTNSRAIAARSLDSTESREPRQLTQVVPQFFTFPEPLQITGQSQQPTHQPLQVTLQPLQFVLQPLQPTHQPTQPTQQSIQPTQQPIQSTNQPPQPTQEMQQPTKQPQQPKPQQPTQQMQQPTKQPQQPKPVQPAQQPQQQPTQQSKQPTKRPQQPSRQPVRNNVPKPPRYTALLQPSRPVGCKDVTVEHLGEFWPLVRPTSGNIYRNKSGRGDTEAMAARELAHAAVAARTGAPPASGTSEKEKDPGVLKSISNPKVNGRNNVGSGAPRMVDICSSIWRRDRYAQVSTRTLGKTTDKADLFAFYSTFTLPGTDSAPETAGGTESPTEEHCDGLPIPYMDDRYDWLEVLAANGGIPGCVNATQRPQPETARGVLNDTCKRPLPSSQADDLLYTYMLSDLRTFYREEDAILQFPGQSNQFIDIRGILVWTSPADDGNIYVVNYVIDDTGLWIYLPRKTCKFGESLTCGYRSECFCVGDKAVCLTHQAGIPANLMAALVGGGR